MNLKGSTIIVTGASSGIGEASAKHLAQAGAKIILLARSKENLERVKLEIEAIGDEPTISFNLYGATDYDRRFEFNPLRATAEIF